ncbi:MAG TPA: BatA domain-containing protein [Gemmatimonadales bacterium]|nr:BatA domain-containing protein [Gemmatimonadales bacterium]
MTFLHPLALVGLAAAAIPALLHLLERRVPPEADFPPLRYLSEAERQNARRLKLRHLLLLILRTALIVLIVLAAARPLFPTQASGGSLHEPTAVAVILDNSVSSGLVVDGRPALERLKAMARGSLARATASDRLWLVLADGVARAGTPDVLLATVDSVGVSARRLDLTAAVRAASRLVDAEPLPAREVHVVSDLQRTALGPGRAGILRGVRVLALAPPSRAPANRGVGAARVTDGAAAVDIVGTPGAGAGGAAPVTLRINGREVGRALVAPGSTASITLPPLGPGWWVGEAVLDADELRADDRRFLVWRVAAPARVTALSSTGGGPFVAAALAVLEEAQRVQRGTEVAIGDRPEAGTRVSVVIPPAEQALIGQANRALAARGGRWRFGSAGTPGPIARAAVPAIAGLQVTRRYRIEVSTGDAGRGTGNDTTVLATVNGEPWLVRDGSVLLLGSRLDTAWTALPAAPAFVPFIDALVNRLARGEAPVAEVEGAPRVEFRTRGADTIGAILSGLDPRESDLTPASPALVREVLGADVLDGAAFMTAGFAGAGRRDGSGLLLLLALLIALGELGVATRTR